jgi:hypothetical protein
LGVQKELSSNILLEVKSVVFGVDASNKSKSSATSSTTTSILSNVQLGVSYLF